MEDEEDDDEEDDDEEEGEGSLRLDMVEACQTVFIQVPPFQRHLVPLPLDNADHICPENVVLRRRELLVVCSIILHSPPSSPFSSFNRHAHHFH